MLDECVFEVKGKGRRERGDAESTEGRENTEDMRENEAKHLGSSS